jgi:hypothetical protein
MKKLMIAVVALLCLHTHLHAQGLMGDPDFFTMDDPDDHSGLYSITPEQHNHRFEYKLPNDGILRVDFLRLSDWGDKNILDQITNLAASQVAALKDSFKSDYSEKLLEMNIPINNDVIAINYTEDLKDKNQLAYKNGNYYQLKTGFDTIRIVKNVSIKKKPLIDSGLVQIQYTFILKDLHDIIALKQNPDIIQRIGAITDSVVNVQRKKWPRQDASSHTLTVRIDANNNDSLSISKLYSRSSSYRGHLGMFLGYGAIVYNNALSPYAEVTFAYFIPTRGKMQGFAGFNFNGFGLVGATTTLKTTQAFYRSYNAEIGVCKKSIGFMAQKTSLIFGIMDVKDEKALFNMGVNLGINRYSSVGINIAGNFKGKENGRYVYGVNLKFNL